MTRNKAIHYALKIRLLPLWAYLENKVYGKENLTKWFYMGSMFRHDKPQAGRYREFHQFGAEVLGSPSPVVDSEVICMIVQLLKQCRGELCRLSNMPTCIP